MEKQALEANEAGELSKRLLELDVLQRKAFRVVFSGVLKPSRW